MGHLNSNAYWLLAILAISTSHLPATVLSNTVEQKIVGGNETGKHEFPWMCDLRSSGHYCGACIISEEWVLTVAHCAVGKLTDYELVAGDHHLGLTEGTEQRREVVKIVRHPLHMDPAYLRYENDIAAMKVSPPFQFNQWIQPIKVPNKTFVPTERAIVTGWGALEEGGVSPVVLHKTDVPVLSDEECREKYEGNVIAASMICCGEGGKDSCQGDSGGSMMCERNGIPYLCGIVSWGYGALGCAREGSPGVYTEVSYFYDWIYETILPPPPDNTTNVESIDTCGEVLNGTLGYISYKLKNATAKYERCTWTLASSEDREEIRVRVLNNGLNDRRYDSIIVTEIDVERAITTTTTVLVDTEEHIFKGPVIFLTFVTGGYPLEGFDLEFVGTGLNQSSGLALEYFHEEELTGSLSYPDGSAELQYSNNALVTFILNPPNTGQLPSANLTMSIESIQLEDDNCAYDFLRVHSLRNRRLQLVVNSTRYCGSIPPVESFETTEGTLLLIFRSDSSTTKSGFTITWKST